MAAYTLGKRIKFFRSKVGYTQEQLAALIGKTKNHIGQMETGQSLPSVPVLYDISLALGVPLDCFFMDDNRMYAEYAALKFEKLLDRFSDEQLVNFVEIQQAIYSVLEKPDESLDLFIVPEKKGKKGTGGNEEEV